MSAIEIGPITDVEICAEADRFSATLVPDPAHPEDPAKTWAAVSEMGWPLCLFPEDVGGLGGDLATLAAIVEGAGRHALSVPLAAACGVVPLLLAPAPRALLVEAVARTADNSWRIVPFLSDMQGQQDRAGGTGVLTGRMLSPHGHAGATHALLAMENSEREALIALIDLDAAHTSTALRTGLDGRPSLELTLDGAAPLVLAEGAAAARAIAHARDIGTALVCVETVAAIGAVLAGTAEHLGSRVQFGQRLAEFQVLRQRFAGLYARHVNARAMVAHLLDSNGLQHHPGTPLRKVSLAKLLVSQLARDVAQQSIQFHGGIGVTDELGVSRLNKRLLCAGFDFGDSTDHLDRLLSETGGGHTEPAPHPHHRDAGRSAREEYT